MSPIIQLSELVDDVSNNRNYTLRVERQGDDEVGRLVRAFNQLLGITQQNQLQMHDLVEELKERSSQLSIKGEGFEQRNEIIKGMFSGASHDLRKPLKVMTAYIKSLKEVASEQQSPLIEKLRQQPALTESKADLKKWSQKSRLRSHHPILP